MLRTLVLMTVLTATFWMQSSEAWLSSRLPPPTKTCRMDRAGLAASSSLSLASSSAESSSIDPEQSQELFTVDVSFEGRSCQVSIRSNETLLSAMERAGVSDRLAIPELPAECRRGNCLTCTGRHSSDSQLGSIQRGEDGLSPTMSREVAQRGYILTCSSHVVGEGLKLELGENHQIWRDVYRNRVEDEAAQLIGKAAVAKTIRLSDERNPERWEVETESAYEKSGE